MPFVDPIWPPAGALGPHRYWAIYILDLAADTSQPVDSQDNPTNFVNLAKVEFAATPGGAAIGGGTAFEAGDGAVVGAFPASNAFDGNDATTWQRGNIFNPCLGNVYIGKDWGVNPLDWPSVQDARMMVANNGNVFGAPKTASLVYSDDGVAFTTVTTRYYGSSWVVASTRSILETNPSNGSARGWDIKVNTNWGSTLGVAVLEMEHVFGGVDIAPNGLSGNGDNALGRITCNGDSSNSRPGADAFDDDFSVGSFWRPAVNQFIPPYHLGIIYPSDVGPLTKMRIYQQGISQDARSVTLRYTFDGLIFFDVRTVEVPNVVGWHDI